MPDLRRQSFSVPTTTERRERPPLRPTLLDVVTGLQLKQLNGRMPNTPRRGFGGEDIDKPCQLEPRLSIEIYLYRVSKSTNESLVPSQETL